MSGVKRIYVEKKDEFAVRAKELKSELREYLDMKYLDAVRVLIRYDVENISEETYQKAKITVFSEPPVDDFYEETFERKEGERVFSVEYLPGQFDQRADSAEQCVKLLNESESPVIRSATTYVLSGEISDADFEKIKEYCINPVDSRQADETKPETLIAVYEEPADVKIFEGFKDMNESSLKELYDSLGLAMTFKDFLHIQNYFCNDEKRDPSMTEIRVLDTYWSDHCRHTTFLTELKNVEFEDGFCHEPIKETYEAYYETHKEIFAGREDKFVSLMDIALMAMRKLKKMGKLEDMEKSDEINACSIVVPVEIDGKEEEWLVFFKNETHNHPTEIEPFGGAATCLGGAIRDPLSGRGYVYQAMRVTGAADPNLAVKDTMKGKLPQRKIVTSAAKGYSSYGNQIGLATGLVNEIYHPDYVAKRMEIGAVMGAAPRKNVIRENSDPGDQIILLGGRTGRDGCGGATGSSKAHTESSIDTCGAEVQKGNAPTERKIQRLFRRAEVSSIIKKCNDFGAGGVSVAIGELADGLIVDLDKVPKKYAGLDGTELAISESQERMAVVVAKKDVEKMLAYANEENLEAVLVAEVTEEPRLILKWRGKEIVNIKRAFLDTNGAHQETDVLVKMPDEKKDYFKEKRVNGTLAEQWKKTMADLNVCSQKGLVEMFDSSIGAATVVMPYGGKYQLTPTQTMIAKLPVMEGKCDTVTMMSYGFDPFLSSWSPYHGAVYAVLSSVAKIVASGGDYKKIRFTFQEYFKRLGDKKENWGEPMAALLGAYHAQMKLGLPSIGGKDSMSGTFNEISVPPTLCSFAVDIARVQDVITPELKEAGNVLLVFPVKKDDHELPDFDYDMALYEKIHSIRNSIASAYSVAYGGIAEAVTKMAFGNQFGIKLYDSVEDEDYFLPDYGAIVVEMKKEDLPKLSGLGFELTTKKASDAAKQIITDINAPAEKFGDVILLGEVTGEAVIVSSSFTLPLEEALEAWKGTLEKVFPTRSDVEQKTIDTGLYDTKEIYVCKHKVAKPKVFIPVFPGTNCEYDTEKSFVAAGASVESVVFNNMDAGRIKDSVDAFVRAINDSQILMFSGGFSAGDEPDGSAKFIASVFQNPRIKDAVMELLNKRDGLVLGICNGFQALIKMGLVPYGEIRPQAEGVPTLTTNSIGRHISKSVYTKVVTNKSPWLQNAELGGVYSIPASHGEGRFVAPEPVIKELFANGQVATQYVDLAGNPTMDEDFNPNGSYYAIEGITSPDGRVLGKMAHSERRGDGVALNITGNQDQKIFLSGVEYYTK